MVKLHLNAVNVGGPKGDDSLREFIASELPSEAVQQRRWPVGVPIAAVDDWHVILSDTAALIAIADLIWRAYVKFGREKNEKCSVHGISVRIGEEDNRDCFIVGRDVDSRKELVQRIKESARRLEEERKPNQ